jgi:hypothetical protein
MKVTDCHQFYRLEQAIDQRPKGKKTMEEQFEILAVKYGIKVINDS